MAKIIRAIFCAGLASACSSVVHTNTPRLFVPSETAELLDNQQMAVGLSYGSESTTIDHLVSGRLRLGLPRSGRSQWELDLDGTFGLSDATFNVEDDWLLSRQTRIDQVDSKFFGSARVGARYRPVPNLALGLAVGGGGYAGGSFLGGDVSATVSTVDDFFVPFFTVRIGLAAPLWSRAISFDVVRTENGQTTRFQTAVVPSGVLRGAVEMGARVSLCPRCQEEPSLYLSVFSEVNDGFFDNYTHANELEVQTNAWNAGLSSSVEILFR